MIWVVIGKSERQSDGRCNLCDAMLLVYLYIDGGISGDEPDLIYDDEVLTIAVVEHVVWFVDSEC